MSRARRYRGASVVLAWGSIGILAFQVVKSKRQIKALAGACADALESLDAIDSVGAADVADSADDRKFLEKYSFAVAPLILGALAFFGSTYESSTTPAQVNAIGATVVAIGAALGMTAEYKSVPSLLPISWAFASIGASVVAYAGFFL